MDPSLTRVIGVEVQDVRAFASTQNSINWASYEFSGSASYRTVPVYQSFASWSIPAVSKPSQGCAPYCEAAVWDSLESYAGATNGYMVQAGSNSGLYCVGSACTTYYYVWYSFLNVHGARCFDAGANHFIQSTIKNRILSGGDPRYYDVTVVDITLNRACTQTNYYYGSMGTPYFGGFMLERPVVPGGLARLARFSSVTIGPAWIYYNGASRQVRTSYLNGWYVLYNMVNAGIKNVNVGPVDSTSSFTVTWLSSGGT